MILRGDSQQVLKSIRDNSIDLIATDPPYGISFMGRRWDVDLPDIEIWKECYRVLKPGGFILAMAATRMSHRLAVHLEDGGFYCVDKIAWVYGQGFSKGTDLSKQLDARTIRKWLDGYDIPSVLIKWRWLKRLLYPLLKRYYNEVKRGEHLTPAQVRKVISAAVNGEYNENGFTPQGGGNKGIGGGEKHRSEGVSLIADLEKRFGEMPKRVKVGEYRGAHNKAGYKEGSGGSYGDDTKVNITAPITEQSKAYEGVKYGMQSLKPSVEIILVFQKKPSTNPVDNILQWGTGGLNIDAGRIGTSGGVQKTNIQDNSASHNGEGFGCNGDKIDINKGRYPANLIIDSSAGAELDKMSGYLHAAGNVKPMRQQNTTSCFARDNHSDNTNPKIPGDVGGGASRFFQTCDYDIPDYLPFYYQAKPSRAEKNAGCEGLPEGEPPATARSKPAEGRQSALGKPRSNTHSTVKPVNLFKYLIDLFKGTCERPVILDPFAGSGTTHVAAILAGCDCISIDAEKEYIEIIRARVKYWRTPGVKEAYLSDGEIKEVNNDLPLFEVNDDM